MSAGFSDSAVFEEIQPIRPESSRIADIIVMGYRKSLMFFMIIQPPFFPFTNLIPKKRENAGLGKLLFKMDPDDESSKDNQC